MTGRDIAAFLLSCVVLLTVTGQTFASDIQGQASAVTASLGAGTTMTLSVPTQGVPAGLIYENLSQPYLLWVELQNGRLHLLERLREGHYVSRKTLPISLGKNGIGKQVEGDRKTPVGVYKITRYLDDAELDDYYGTGAYPVNFPNVWDRLLKRTGYGIWLHGLPKGVSSRPLLDSDGCIVVDNDSMLAMSEYISPGESLFVFARSLDWLPAGSQQPDADIVSAIERWRMSWEDNEIEKYLSNYHPDFTDMERDLQDWSSYKARINRAKTFIRVDLSELSAIRYPDEDNLVTVRFYQHYESSNYVWKGWKQLLWRRDETGVWRILYEGNG